MKITRFYNPEIPYSLHDMNVIEFEVNGDNLVMRTQSGMVRTAPNRDQVDGYLEFLDVNWEYCYATVCEGYYAISALMRARPSRKCISKTLLQNSKTQASPLWTNTTDKTVHSIRDTSLRAVRWANVEVYEKPEKYSRTCGNPVVIYYKLQMRKHETLSVMFGTYEEDAEENIPA